MKRIPRGQKNLVYWWSDHIAQIRKECIAARREYIRSKERPQIAEVQEAFKLRGKYLRNAIKNVK